ncbi:hypothetical protein F5B22DRAFT_641718 [Xylaria bambusicola]|uniref:uncharacterized protein n=1 Tax=Xylaria bambusicola TaxID=326684 RepID=UPI0020073F9F|nr:uncharacterized protein F5B22DRAFT_641718 [Xylaria bambusicola]KAI0526575.1 hypothetical protein F5B22DRAFT_641718 [Xylaria bambusicola]
MKSLGKPARQLLKLCENRAAFQRVLTFNSAMQRCSSHTSPPCTSSSPIDFEAIKAEMLARPVQIHTDSMYATNSRLLTTALADFLPEECLFELKTPKTSVYLGDTAFVPPGHHLVYFPLELRGSQLCPDGTDPYHSPRGTPFTRRMWAGGSIQGFEGLTLDGRGGVCVERIEDVKVHGPTGSEKIYVEVLRIYLKQDILTQWQKRASSEFDLPRDLSEHGLDGMTERRTLVFMRELSDENKLMSMEKKQKVIKAPSRPKYSVTLRPTPTLLFHYSALSYNAHRIHLDSSYCREVEGYQDLLVHGPLSLTLMLSVLKSSLTGSGYDINKIDYRHIAPLYVDQTMHVCCAPRASKCTEKQNGTTGRNKWDVWVENQDGGLCVKGTVETMKISNDA